MKLTPIDCDLTKFPSDILPYLDKAKLLDSSSSHAAKVVFIDKDNGYFLKSAAKGSLANEANMAMYFHNKGLSAKVVRYITDEKDWLLTERIAGDDCIAQKYLDNPTKLCDIIAERLTMLHCLEHSGCPIQNYTAHYLESVKRNYESGNYDKTNFPDSYGFATAEEAWKVIASQGQSLKTDTLLHGDYCLPNIILNNWKFSGFIDLGNGGVGDRHVDIFWGEWSLCFNLKTDKYRERFYDAYGRNNIDIDILRVVAAAEVFG